MVLFCFDFWSCKRVQLAYAFGGSLELHAGGIPTLFYFPPISHQANRGKIENWIRHDAKFRIVFKFHRFANNAKDPNEKFSVSVLNLHEWADFSGL